ncbi:MAG: NAD(P)-dependent oxidoreductase [Rhodobacteraceae bacterium]|nr:NAD(P)-dependent oxidoreductase [Paracoccaceae bacterium]
MKKHLLSFGHGYTAQALAKYLLPKGWKITGTTRDPSKLERLRETGISALHWGDQNLEKALETASAMLISASPNEEGDPTYLRFGRAIRQRTDYLRWIGYLSTSGVYGDFGGNWVDEDTQPAPSTKRGKMRLLAENQWKSLENLPLHIFRLAGIYGPGRGPFSKIRAGTAKRVVKDRQVFSRIHVEDIVQILVASLRKPKPGQIYNLCDDNPAPPQDVIAYSAELLGLPLPPLVNFEDAELSEMARSFYAENKRIKNNRIKTELGICLKYPNYRQGLKDLLTREATG